MTTPVITTPHRIRGPRPLPMLGARANLLRFFRDPARSMLRLWREYGSVAALTDGDASFVCAFGPEHNRQVLSAPDAFVNNDRFLFPVPEDGSIRRLETGLPLMNGEAHRRLRRLMGPFFQRAAIEQHTETMVRIIDAALDRLARTRVVDMAAEMLDTSLRVALDCLFGLRGEEDIRRLRALGTLHLEGLTSAGAMLLPYDLPGTPYWRLTRVSDELDKRLRDLVRAKRARLGPNDRDVFAAILGARDEGGEPLSDDELVGQANTLFLAGYETTANALSWTLFLLAQHPRAAAELCEELSGVLRGGAPTAETIARLPLLDAVVKEGMRLLPPAPMTFLRYAAKGAAIGGVELAPGAAVILSPLVTHRMPDLFSDAARFRPERWERLRPSPYEYLPFGAGPRTCIGAALAGLEIRVALAMLLQRFRLAMARGARVSQVVRGITMGPRHGLPMIVEPRDGSRTVPVVVRGDIHAFVDLPSGYEGGR